MERCYMMPASLPTVLIPDVCYGTVGDTRLLLDILQPELTPEKGLPVVVEIHPGGWMYGEKYGLRNQFLAEHGFFTASINYRLSGEAPFPAQIDDVKRAIRWLRSQAQTYHLDPGRIGVWGESSGGHLAALLGTSADRQAPEEVPEISPISAQVQAVATISGPTDLVLLANPYVTALLGGPPQSHAHLANPVSFLTDPLVVPPFLIIHGTHDTQVPLQQAMMLYEALKAVEAEVTFQPVEADHNLMGSAFQATGQALLLEFFTRHLRDADSA